MFDRSLCSYLEDRELRMKVLVVEDEMVIQMIHKAMLGRLGIKEVEIAANGQAAIDLHAGGASFDLILMDLHMPVMDGSKATRALRAMRVRSPIVGVTATDDWTVKAEFVASGLDDCVPKPLVIDHITKYLN
ncbi:Two-component response regulator 24 [Linum grandiflorum]